MNKINLIGLLLFTTTLSVFANTNETVKSNFLINQFETSNVSAIPSIATQPQPTLDVCLGDAIALSVVASPGTGTVSYQWQKDGVDIGAETAANLNISVTTATDGGVYQCIVTDDDGSVTSSTSTVTVNSLPTIGITGNLIICEGQTTTLTASGALKYDWGSGFTNVAAFDVTPSATSNYVVIGEDSNGCVASNSVQVQVSPLPAASITSNASVCSGADAQFIITGTPNAVVTYKLNSGVDTDATLNNSGTFSVTIPTALSDQTLSLIKVANSTCETILSASKTVLVNPIPAMPAVSSPITYCQDDIAIALSATGTDLKWYLASTSGAPLSEAPTPETSNPGEFLYYVSQTINGCESPRAEVKVQVNVIPLISISGSDTICLGESTTLNAAGAISYVWSPGGETTSIITVSPTSNTIYSVTGTDADGCSSSETLTVIVNAVPTASLSVSGPICSGDDALFSITGSANATVVYSIDSGADQSVVLDSSGLASISETNQVSDVEMRLVSVNNAECTVALSDLETITVNPNATAPAVNSPIEYCLNETATALTAAFNTGNSLVWYDFDGTQLPSSPTPQTSNAESLTYEVSQINAFGCESPRSQITVIVKPLPQAPSVVASEVNLCLNEAASPLDTSGISNPRWYDAPTAGNFLGTTLTPVTTSLATTDFYVSQTIDGCEGPRTQVDVIVNSVPSAPAVPSTSVFYCKNDTATPLTAITSTSGTLNWYLVASGGIGSLTPPSIDTNAVGTNTYYVSETNNLGCESLRTAITVTIDDIPSTPTVGLVTNPSCSSSTGSVELSNLPAGNWTVTNITNGTTYSNSGSNPYTVSGLNSGTYTFSVSNGTCESLATNSVTINPIPVQSAPVVGTLVQPSCTTSTGSVTLTDLPSTGNWTLTRVSDNVSITDSGTSRTISGLPSGTHNYTVTNSQGCTSVASLNIVIDAQPTLPNAPIANAQSFLESDSATISDLQISSSGSPVWYNQAVSGTQYCELLFL